MPPFQRQGDEPLYPAVLWNRPVARQAGGRLLIVGGHRGDFSLPTALHELTLAAGIGQATVVLPDALRPLLAGAPDVVFVPSSPAGSLGRVAQAEILELLEHHDGLLLAGLSNNSETVTLVEALLQHYPGPLITAGDTLEVLGHQAKLVTERANAALAITWPQLLKLAGQLNLTVKLDRADLAGKLAILQTLTAASPTAYLTLGPELISAGGDTQPIVTTAPGATANPSAVLAATATFWIQNPGRASEALASAAFVLSRALPDQAAATQQLVQALRRALDQF